MAPDLQRTTFSDFEALAKGSDIVAICHDLRGDSETPVSAFRKLRGRHRAFLFESVEGPDRWARHSFLGADPHLTVVQQGDQSTVIEGRKTRRISGKPLDVLRSLISPKRLARAPGLPRFVGGLVGYLSYSAVRWLEPHVPARLGADPDFPDAEWMLFDQLVAFDNVRHRLKLIACADLTAAPSLRGAYRSACERLDQLHEGLQRRLPPDGRWEPPKVSAGKRESYEQGVARVREYIRAGDCMQVVLSRRLTAKYTADPFELYRQLRASQPAPYLFFLELGGKRALAGASPELLVRVEDRKVTVRPIAGTRPRGIDPAQDLALEAALRADPKELAEHVMLLDLGRNDVGRVAKPGTVRVVEREVIERYSHVMHLVSEVTGILRDDLDPLDAVAATFPAGTVSGAPKVRAMQIIDELERTPRGPYAGAVGYLGYGGSLDLAIAIRSVALCKDRLRFQAGAGLVHDSDPATEFDETSHKLRGILSGLEASEAPRASRPPRGGR